MKNSSSSKIKSKSRVKWRASSPTGSLVREGVVIGYVPAGQPVKQIDVGECKFQSLNSIHDRYLIEIKRVDKRNGRKRVSKFMAPKARWLEKNAKILG